MLETDFSITPEKCLAEHKPFAWISYDVNTGITKAARDPFGQVPLFYYSKEGEIIFANSIKEILGKISPTPELTERVVLECFTHQMGDFVPEYSRETFFKNIFRVTPGCIASFNAQGELIKEEPYWVLDPEGPDIILPSEEAYHERFSELLKESLSVLVPKENILENKLAHELSGGLDSSSILMAAQELGISPNLLTHAGPDSFETSEHESVLYLIKKYGLEDKHRFIDASDFDPIESLIKAAEIFPGGSPYLFFPLANNIHQAVSQRGYKTLISGFAGDECISSHAGNLGYIHTMLKRREYSKLWKDWRASCVNRKLSVFLQGKDLYGMLRYSHPKIYDIFRKYHEIRRRMGEKLGRLDPKDRVVPSPWFPSVRHRDYSFLQGHRSHTTKMRVEYSALAARALGFEYCYPFLYRPLVEFCFYLPPWIKRRNGLGRYLIWEYFSKRTPGFIPDKRKMTGSIMPGTFAKCQEYLLAGKFEDYLKNSKFSEYLSNKKHLHIQTIEVVHAFMWQAYLNALDQEC